METVTPIGANISHMMSSAVPRVLLLAMLSPYLEYLEAIFHYPEQQ